MLLVGFALFWLRGPAAGPGRGVPARPGARGVAVYLAVLALTVGSDPGPRTDRRSNRIAVPASLGSRFATVTVDSVLLADLLDRGVQGVRLLSERQQRAVTAYVDAATATLSGQLAAVPRPRPGETMLMGYSDLHCNQAMTELITRLARVAAAGRGAELGRRHRERHRRRAGLHPPRGGASTPTRRSWSPPATTTPTSPRPRCGAPG